MKIKEIDKKLGGIGGAYNIIQEIAELIYMEMDLRYQDRWLEKMIEQGIYNPQFERAKVGACCRNGCEKCEQ